jgi:FKBP-type peptidyl-prolyl cis-trans isomerase FklB
MNRKMIAALLSAGLTTANVYAADPALTTEDQKFSYAVGIQIIQSMVRQGVTLDTTAFKLAADDVIAGKEPRLTPDEMNAAMEAQGKAAQARSEARAKTALEAGKAFLEENKSKPGVQTLPSGIQYTVTTEGSGKSPTLEDSVTVHYAGRLTDGREFDSSYRRNEPFTLTPSSVIKGWQEVLPLMKEGAKWTVYIPSELAYGPSGAGGSIGPNEVLVFDIELISVNASTPPATPAEPTPAK